MSSQQKEAVKPTEAEVAAMVAAQEQRTGSPLQLSIPIMQAFIDRAQDVILRDMDGDKEGVTGPDGRQFFLAPIYAKLVRAAEMNPQIFMEQFFLLNTSTITLDIDDCDTDYLGSLEGDKLHQPVLTDYTGTLIDGTHRAMKLRMMGRDIIFAFMLPKQIVDAIANIRLSDHTG